MAASLLLVAVLLASPPQVASVSAQSQSHQQNQNEKAKSRSPTDAFLLQLRRNWRSVLYKQQGLGTTSYSYSYSGGGYNRGSQHRFVQEAYVNMAVMCTSQARQLAATDLSSLNKQEPTYLESLSDYGNCLFEMADLLSEFPQVGTDTSTLKFEQSGLNKAEVTAKFAHEGVFMLLQRAAELGQADAQHRLSAAYATGILHAGAGGLVPMDAGKGLMLEYISALSGNPEANMGMGYRYAHGIGVPESCEKALLHYEVSANHAVHDILDKGYALPHERTHLSELEKPGYRKAAVDASADPEVISYYRQLAEEGDATAAATLGKMYSTGSRVLDIDYSQAVKFLELAADAGNLHALGHLSYVLAQGLGGAANSERFQDAEIFEMARKCAARGEPSGHMALGYAYMHGVGVAVNHSKAFETFEKIHAKSGDAAFLMAEMLMGRGSAKEKAQNGSNSPGGPGAALNMQSRVGADGTVTGVRGLEHSDDPAVQATSQEIGELLGSATPEMQLVLGRINLMDPEALRKEMNLAPALRTQLAKLQKDLRAKVEKLNNQKSRAATKETRNNGKSGAEAKPAAAAKTTGKPQRSHHDDYAAAALLYASASQRGHIVSLHRLAHMSKNGVGVAQSCHTAMHGLKSVAERGHWVRDLMRAHRRYDAGDKGVAMTLFSRFAAIGYESAQFNAAHLLASSTGGSSSVASKVRTLLRGATSLQVASSVCPTWAVPGDKVAAAYRQVEAANDADAEKKYQEQRQQNQRAGLAEPLRPRSRFQYAAHFNPQLSLLGLNSSQWSWSWRDDEQARPGATATKNMAPSNDDLEPPATAAADQASVPERQRHTKGQQQQQPLGEFSFHGGALEPAKQQQRGGSKLGESVGIRKGDASSSDSGGASVSYSGYNQDAARDCEDRALALYGLSASQGSAEAYIRIGDFYYYGMGHLAQDSVEAVALYQNAADLHHTHALFNLGLMYELGDGVAQDFFLAKRFYDQAAEYNPEAAIPRNVAMWLMRAHQYLQGSKAGEACLRVLLGLFAGSHTADSLLSGGPGGDGMDAALELGAVVVQASLQGAALLLDNAVVNTLLFPPRLLCRYGIFTFLRCVWCIDRDTYYDLQSLLASKDATLPSAATKGIPPYLQHVVLLLPHGEATLQVHAAAVDTLALVVSSMSYMVVYYTRRHYHNALTEPQRMGWQRFVEDLLRIAPG